MDPDGNTDITIEINRMNQNAIRTLGIMSVTNSMDNSTLNLYTLEPPDNNNQRNKSRINEGTYGAHRSTSPIHGDVIKLDDTKDRTDILIHSGNTARDTQGCILPGRGQSENSVTGSKDAQKQIINYVDSIRKVDQESGQTTNIRVIIKNRLTTQ